VVLVVLVLLLAEASAWLATGCYCKGAVVLVALVLLSLRSGAGVVGGGVLLQGGSGG
jgi:hypothetical protein